MDHRLYLSVEVPEDMVALGQYAGEMLFDGAVIGLSGPLGTGKTTLARGIAEGMGINEDYVVSSPTYTLMQSYPCRDRLLHHLDLYRITSSEDLDSTGYRDSIGGAHGSPGRMAGKGTFRTASGESGYQDRLPGGREKCHVRTLW